MEFEEMKMIWDQQNQQPLYAYDQEALHKRIRSKLKGSQARVNVTEFALVAICLGTAATLLAIGSGQFFSYMTMLALVAIAGYTLRRHHLRQKRERQFDRSMLGDLDLAIAQARHLAQQADTFLWWFLLPVAIPSLVNMIANAEQKAPWQWLFVVGCFILSYFVVRLGLRRQHLPRQRELEKLRATLTRDMD